MKLAHGIDFSSGSLGHNLSVGAGMALAGPADRPGLPDLRAHRRRRAAGGPGLGGGDGGVSHYKLGNLIAIVDANGFSGAGPTSQAMNIEPLGRAVRGLRLDGAGDRRERRAAVRSEDFDELPDPSSEAPVVIIARTRKGHGVEFMEKQPQAWHLGLLNDEQYADVGRGDHRPDGADPMTENPVGEKKMVDVFSDVDRETRDDRQPGRLRGDRARRRGRADRHDGGRHVEHGRRLHRQVPRAVHRGRHRRDQLGLGRGRAGQRRPAARTSTRCRRSACSRRASSGAPTWTTTTCRSASSGGCPGWRWGTSAPRTTRSRTSRSRAR